MNNGDFVKPLKLMGTVFFIIGFALVSFLFFEEFLTFFNYYYTHQVSFDLLVVVGFSTFIAGLIIMLRE